MFLNVIYTYTDIGSNQPRLLIIVPLLLSIRFNFHGYISFWCFHSLLHAIQFPLIRINIIEQIMFYFYPAFSNYRGGKLPRRKNIVDGWYPQHNTIKLIKNATRAAVVFVRSNRQFIQFMWNDCVNRKTSEIYDKNRLSYNNYA